MRLGTFLSTVVALILIVPIAFASPPDPSWIAGIYDGADGDEVVTLVYEIAGVEAVLLGSVRPLHSSSNVSLVSGAGAIHGFPPHQFTRGPPSMFALIIYDAHSRLRRLARFHAHIPLRNISPPSDTFRMRIAAIPLTSQGKV